MAFLIPVALGSVGAWLGGSAVAFSAFGMSVTWGTLGWIAGSLIGTYLVASMQDSVTIDNVGPRLNNLSSAVSDIEGSMIPIIYGTRRLSGKVLWSSNIRERVHTQTFENEGGKGKGGGGSVTQTTYTYDANVAYALCEGPIQGVKKIWINKKLVYSDEPVNGQIKLADLNFKVYLGDETQLPDNIMESEIGVGKTPAYRGLAYIMFYNLQLADYGNTIPVVVEAEVVKLGSDSVKTDIIQTYDINFSNATENLLYKDKCILYLPYSSGEQFYIVNATNGTILKRYTPPQISGLDSYIEKNDIQYSILDNTWYITFVKDTTKGELYKIDCNTMVLSYIDNPGDDYKIVGKLKSGQLLAVIEATDSINPYYNTYIYEENNGAYTIYNVENLNTTNQERIICLYYDINTKNEYILYSDANGLLSICKNLNIVKRDFSGTYKYDFSNNIFTTINLYANSHTMANILVNENTDEIFIAGSLWDGSNTYAIAKLDSDFNILKKYILDITQSTSIDINNGNIIIDSATTTYIFNIYSETYYTINSGSFPYGDIFNFNPSANTVTYIDDGNLRTSYNYISNTSYLLSDIYKDIFNRVGIDITNEVNFEGSTYKEVYGYSITDIMSAKNACEPLNSTYFIDIFESDWKINLKDRLLNLTPEILDETYFGSFIDVNNENSSIVINKPQEIELPKAIELKYIGKDNSQQIRLQRSEKQITDSRNKAVINLPIVLEDEYASKLTDILLYNAFISENKYTIILPKVYNYLQPGDLVQFTYENKEHIFRISEVDTNLLGSIKIVGPREYLEVYDSVKEYIKYTEELYMVPVTSIMYIYSTNLPAIEEIDSSAYTKYGLYISATSLDNNWTGGVIFTALSDIESEYLRYADANNSAKIGYISKLENFIKKPDNKYWDKQSKITVQFINIDKIISSATEEEVLQGYNIAALVDGDYVEIIQFTNVINNSDGTFTISNLLRGRYDTNYNYNNNLINISVGKLFIVLTELPNSPLGGVKYTIENSNINRTYYFKGVSYNSTMQNALPSISSIYYGEQLKTYSPKIEEFYLTSSNEYYLKWNMVSRISSPLYHDATLTESEELYKVEIYDYNTNNKIVEYKDISSRNWTYTTAMMTNDGITYNTQIYIKLYQKSDIFGYSTHYSYIDNI